MTGDRVEYEDSLKAMRDWFSTMQTAELKGEARGLELGREQEKRSIASKLKSVGTSLEVIAQVSGLSIEEIDKL